MSTISVMRGLASDTISRSGLGQMALGHSLHGARTLHAKDPARVVEIAAA